MTVPGMDDLVAWLRQQLDEDERVARRTMGNNVTGRWHTETAVGYLHEAVTDESGVRLATGPERINEHIARHDPARVLREVEAKRRIVDEYAATKKVLDLTEAVADVIRCYRPTGGRPPNVDRTSEHYKRVTRIIWDWFAVADTATIKLLYERLEAAGLLFTVDLETRLFDAEAALAELARVSDGPRNEAYELACARAKAVLSQIPAS